MSARLLLYTRKDCRLCDAMKSAVREAAADRSFPVEEIDVDSVPGLAEKYGSDVPVLFINGRKAFKYRATVKELRKRLRREGL
jgi:glutaredoxin